MLKYFNSKIFAVASIPFFIYVIMIGFVFVNSGYRWDVFEPISVLLICLGMLLSAFCFAFSKRQLHYLATLLMMALGGIGIYVGFTGSNINWIELICSAGMIAYAFALFQFVGHRLRG